MKISLKQLTSFKLKISYLQKFILLHTILVLLLFYSWYLGLVQRVIEYDSTYISQGIFIVFLLSLVLLALKRFKASRWVSNRLVLLGLIGTVVGIIISLTGVYQTLAGGEFSPEVIKTAIVAMFGGMMVALYTTLVGSLGYLWAITSIRLLEPNTD